MKKYYVIEITTKADTTTKGVYEYATENEAVASFHSKMGGAMKNKDYLGELLMVIDDNGAVLKVEKYNAPQPEPQPEEEATEE